MCGGNSRLSRPRSSGWPSGPKTMRVTPPSQASIRARAAEIDRPETGAGRAVAGVRVDQVLVVDGDHHVRLDGAQERQVPGGQGVVGQLDEGVGLLLAAAAGVPGGPAGLHDRLQRGLHLLPAHRVEFEPARQAPSACRVIDSARCPRWGRARCRRGRAGPGSGAPPAPVRLTGRVAAVSASTASTAARSTPAAAAAARCSSRATGAITATASAVTRPAANAAATAGRCSSARPDATSRCAAAADSRPCPRSQDCIVFAPSCSEAWVSSPSRTVRASWASSRFFARQQPPRPLEHLRAEHALQILVGHPVQGVLEVGERVTRTVRTHVRRIPDCTAVAHPESPGQRPVHRSRAALDRPSRRRRSAGRARHAPLDRGDQPRPQLGGRDDVVHRAHPAGALDVVDRLELGRHLTQLLRADGRPQGRELDPQLGLVDALGAAAAASSSRTRGVGRRCACRPRG